VVSSISTPAPDLKGAEAIDSSPSSPNLTCCCRSVAHTRASHGASGATASPGPSARASPSGAARSRRFWGALLAGHGARQAAHSWAAASQAGAQDGGASAAGWAGLSTRSGLVSTDSFASKMELTQAAGEQDFEKVKVRRPLEVVSSSE